MDNVKCPNCGDIFNTVDTFYWSADSDGYPTIENLRCPNCNAGTESVFECSMCPHEDKCTKEIMCPCCDTWEYEKFEIVESEIEK